MRILIADDDGVTIDALDAMLAHLGYNVVVARDGTQAWDLIQREDAPPLVILDWMMPGMDGVEICRRLRGGAKRPYQYIIMLTAKDTMRDLVEGLESGADDYLRKPFDERELRARLHAGVRILTLHDELRARATFDRLTGLLNRDSIIERLEREIAIAERGGALPSIVLADLDNFKRVNDTHGHLVGDEVLREASKRLGAPMRRYDEVGRYGGEEFLLVLPGCSLAAAVTVAERVRDSVGSTPINTTVGEIEVTASLGIASLQRDVPSALDALLARADGALYSAKRRGRNRVEVAADET